MANSPTSEPGADETTSIRPCPIENLKGVYSARSVALHGGEHPRLSIITSAGVAHVKLTDMQIALLVEDGSAHIRKKLTDA